MWKQTTLMRAHARSASPACSSASLPRRPVAPSIAGKGTVRPHRPIQESCMSTTDTAADATILVDRRLEGDASVGCVLLTGSERAFAAGADIKEMAEATYMDMYLPDWFAGWDAVANFRKPIVAAVAGYALGGGCELAMMCDVLIAADTA